MTNFDFLSCENGDEPFGDNDDNENDNENGSVEYKNDEQVRIAKKKVKVCFWNWNCSLKSESFFFLEILLYSVCRQVTLKSTVQMARDVEHFLNIIKVVECVLQLL